MNPRKEYKRVRNMGAVLGCRLDDKGSSTNYEIIPWLVLRGVREERRFPQAAWASTWLEVYTRHNPKESPNPRRLAIFSNLHNRARRPGEGYPGFRGGLRYPVAGAPALCASFAPE